MATPHDIFHSADYACSQFCVSFQVKISTLKLQMSLLLYLEYIHVVSQCCCGGYTRDYAAPERSIQVTWKVSTYIHSAHAYIHKHTQKNKLLSLNRST